MRCGLLGKKLGHSYSPQIHSYLGNYSYHLFEKAPDELAEFLRSGDFSGLNVTIPYKKEVLPYCNALSDRAKALGAVNTIVRREDGSLIGHNTDFFGFHSMLLRCGIQVSGKKVLVLGSGGASATVVAVLRQMKANIIVISRSGENNYQNLHLHADASVIVNTTPVGMYPNVDISPLNLDLFPNLEGVLDVVYNPARTQLLMDAEKRGIPTQNGLWMLVAQAKESAEWFTGQQISDECIANIHGILRRQMENIVLIGMPGCGKSTLGKLLAERTGKQFVDADAEIVRKAGIAISQIFANVGEEGFRKLETEVLSELGKESGLIIATGGGCVTRPNNYNLLHQNGHIIWIQRQISSLPTDGRPLSQQNNLETMFAVRKPLYEQFADFSVINDGSLEETITAILQKEGYL
ncbi:MAG: shikimate kinase [Oscillospiraceae bacterium]|nr:shikimate kinase [Oscillospiraceae bacterium]